MRTSLRQRIGKMLADYLSQPRATLPNPGVLPSAEELGSTIRPGDVLLVDGDSKFSVAVKYLTQSSWSHAALVVGVASTAEREVSPIPQLLEADVAAGVTLVPLSKYTAYRTRICRPFGLTGEEIERVIRFARARLGHRYDLRNVVDLARYLLAQPPVPVRRRRRMLALGSGDPTRAICSTLVAQAFQSVGYPILPDVDRVPNGACDECTDEILHIRHHSLFAPRDFDLSPFFQIVKPRVSAYADHRRIAWGALGEPHPGIEQSGECDGNARAIS